MSKIRVPVWSISGEVSLLGCRLLSSVFTWQKEKQSSLGSLIRARIPLMKDPPLSPNYFPKAPSTNTITLGLGFQHTNWGVGGMQT